MPVEYLLMLLSCEAIPSECLDRSTIVLERTVHGLAYSRRRQIGGDRLYEIGNVRPDVGGTAEGDVTNAAVEKMIRAARPEVPVAYGIDGDVGENGNAKPQLDIGLTNVGVDGTR